MKYITPEVCRQILTSEVPCPTELTQFFSGKNLQLLTPFAKGFRLCDANGDVNTDEIEVKTFNRWYKSVNEVRVYTLNREKEDLRRINDWAQERIKWDQSAYYNLNRLIESTSAITKTLNKYSCNFMQVDQYEKFYKSGVAHWVDMCNNNFFIQYPNAKRASDRK